MANKISIFNIITWGIKILFIKWLFERQHTV